MKDKGGPPTPFTAYIAWFQSNEGLEYTFCTVPGGARRRADARVLASAIRASCTFSPPKHVAAALPGTNHVEHRFKPKS